MKSDPFEILSAFVDGESLDPSALADALAAPGAREALVDFVRLREIVAADPAVPSPAFYGSMELELGLPMRLRARRWPRRFAAGLAAALLLACGLLAGFALRGRTDVRPESSVPPAPTREVRFTDGVDWFHS